MTDALRQSVHGNHYCYIRYARHKSEAAQRSGKGEIQLSFIFLDRVKCIDITALQIETVPDRTYIVL